MTNPSLAFQPEQGAKECLFNQSKFSPIQPEQGKILFIDGGSMSLAETPSFTLALIRVYYCIFDNGKKIRQKRLEAKVKVTDVVSIEEGALCDLLKEFPAPSLDACRRNAELLLAAQASSLLKRGDVLCIDGSLCPKDDKKALSHLANKCAEQGVMLAGFCKTSDLLTKDRKPIGNALGQETGLEMWQYAPCQEVVIGETIVQTCFAKLHPRSRHVFRIDTSDKDAIPILASHCKDPSFFGYPYGLIVADQFARIGYNEAERIKLLLKVRNPGLMAQEKDAHGILDAINAPKIQTKRFK
ncbi:MAG: DNA double-strand break repair nuclease NurA [Nanoarchaeota archaeon]